jgi:hypothetical protein
VWFIDDDIVDNIGTLQRGEGLVPRMATDTDLDHFLEQLSDDEADYSNDDFEQEEAHSQSNSIKNPGSIKGTPRANIAESPSKASKKSCFADGLQQYLSPSSGTKFSSRDHYEEKSTDISPKYSKESSESKVARIQAFIQNEFPNRTKPQKATSAAKHSAVVSPHGKVAESRSTNDLATHRHHVHHDTVGINSKSSILKTGNCSNCDKLNLEISRLQSLLIELENENLSTAAKLATSKKINKKLLKQQESMTDLVDGYEELKNSHRQMKEREEALLEAVL